MHKQFLLAIAHSQSLGMRIAAMKGLSLAFLVANFFVAQAQLTLNVTAVPANTTPGASIYVAGTFNTWNPGDATKILTPMGGGQYSITLFPPNGTVEFKFTRGS